MASTVKWPAKNTAFLLIHGNGPKREYETLDNFTRTFKDVLQNPQVEHRLGDRRQGCIRFNRPSHSYIDFYEYYWDRFMVREIQAKELKDFLKEIYDRIKDREFSPRNYHIPFFLSLFRSPPLLGSILTNVQFTKKRMIEYAKDVPIYCLHNQRSKYSDIRENLLSGAVGELIGLLESPEDYKQIIVVGHSLGSVIAYDALNRIARDLSSSSPSLDDTQAQNIRGLVTFGSFLDMVAFFFEAEKHVPKENCIERQIAVERHCFRTPAARSESNPIDYSKLDKVKWVNFYHPDDFVANQPLISYELDENDQMLCNKKGGKAGELTRWEWLQYKIPFVKSWKRHMDAHGSYWKDENMYQKIAETFF